MSNFLTILSILPLLTHASPILPKRDQRASDGQVVTAAEAAKVPFGLGTLPLPSLDPRSSNSTADS